MAQRKWYSDTTLRKPATHPPNSGKFPSQPLPRQQAHSTSHKTYPQQPSVTRLMGHIGKETCKVIYDTSYIVLTIHPNSYSLNASTFIAHLRAHQNIYSLRQISSVSYVHGSLADVIAADPSPTNCLGPISPFTSPPVFLPLHSPFFAHPHYLRLLLTPPSTSISLPPAAGLPPALPPSTSLNLPPSACLPPSLPQPPSPSLPPTLPPTLPPSLPQPPTHLSHSLLSLSPSLSFSLDESPVFILLFYRCGISLIIVTLIFVDISVFVSKVAGAFILQRPSGCVLVLSFIPRDRKCISLLIYIIIYHDIILFFTHSSRNFNFRSRRKTPDAMHALQYNFMYVNFCSVIFVKYLSIYLSIHVASSAQTRQ